MKRPGACARKQSVRRSRKCHLTCDRSKYDDQAEEFCRKYGVRVSVGKDPRCRHHFMDDRERGVRRWVFAVTISRDETEELGFGGGRRMRISFGQSLAAGSRPPTTYEVLACLQKYSPGSFDRFCRDLGYVPDSRSAERLWRRCVREWKAVERVFADEECLEALRDIV